MDRREFLRLSALGASSYVVLGSASCASLPKIRPSRSPSQNPADMDAYLARVDSGMDAIAAWSPTEAFPGYDGDRAAADALGRKSLRTMYMTAMFADLPESGQRHPGMQERIWNSMPEMDEATARMEAFLAGQTEEQLRRLQQALRSPRNPAMEIFGALDAQAARCGVSTPRRHQTRVLLTEANFRLRNQPPSLVIAESLDKVRRMTETDVSRRVREDWIAARAGERLFWQAQEASDREPDSLIVTPPERAIVTSGASVDDAVEGEFLRRKRLRRGARLMGIGLLVGGIAAAAIAAEAWPFVFVATVGAVLIIIGLITLLVGLVTDENLRTTKKK
ncbi:MAG TPA: hypothetical protein VLT84_07365 [Acidobacteriota bacterium]|nr:hypothetical protein [Acidobacteriota bacterium]